jgi:hypothetical protein
VRASHNRPILGNGFTRREHKKLFTETAGASQDESARSTDLVHSLFSSARSRGSRLVHFKLCRRHCRCFPYPYRSFLLRCAVPAAPTRLVARHRSPYSFGINCSAKLFGFKLWLFSVLGLYLIVSLSNNYLASCNTTSVILNNSTSRLGICKIINGSYSVSC